VNASPIIAAHVARSFSRAASSYDAQAELQQRVMLQAFNHALEHFSAQAEILDLGCGTGNFARHAQLQMPNWRVDGLDIAHGMLAAAAPYYRQLFAADIAQMPIANASYDYVFSSLALQWLADKQQAFAEIARVLKPGGVAVLAVLAENTLCELKKSAEFAGMESPVINMHKAYEYENWAQQAGLQIKLCKAAPERQNFANIGDLFAHLRAIGATNQMAGRARHFTAPSKFKALIQAYNQHFSNDEGIYASWDSLLLIVTKPEAKNA
jgi:malonyl-CoA O-methyltransferase